MSGSISMSLLTAPATFVLYLSEDAYKGDAQFTFSVDGVQVGGIQSANVLHATGRSQAFSFASNLSGGAHVVDVSFINDAYGGTSDTDRNLYIEGLDLNDVAVPGAKAQLFSAGTARFAVAAPTPVPTPALPTPVIPAPPDGQGSGSGTLTLHMSEDAYGGDAQFTVAVDGTPVGGVRTVAALHGAGQSQAVVLTGISGTGGHKVAVTFINDAYGGTASTDRNLYVDSIDFNGNNNVAGAASLTSNGTASLNIPDTASAGADSLTLRMSEDAWLGDAQFTVSVDGRQVGGVNTATTHHDGGGSQIFNLGGSFGSGPHAVAISFINDAYGGTSSTDRNLYVDGIDVNGVRSANTGAMLASNGTASFSVPSSTTEAVVVTPPAPVSPPPAPVPAPSGPSLYVSAGGSDGGDGSQAHPFATLQWAVGASEGSGIRTITVQAGTYAPNDTLVLGARNAGLTIVGSGNAVIDGQGRLDGLISLAGTSGVTIAGLTLQNSRGPAVLLTGSDGNTIQSNRVLSSAGSAIELKDGSDGNKIDNNWIDGVGATETSGGGIYLHGANGNQLTHNQIQHTKGSGIALSDFYRDSAGTQNNGNTIAYNRLLDTAQTAGDSGAIYLLGRSGADTQNNVTMNFVQGVGRADQHSVGIYLDDNVNGVSVTGNIVIGAGSDGFQIHGGSNNSFGGNVFDLGSSSASVGLFQSAPSDQAQHPMVNNSFAGNVVVSGGGSPRNPLFAIDNGGQFSISNNDYWSSTGDAMNTGPDASPKNVNPGFGAGGYTGNGAGIGFAGIAEQLIGSSLSG